MYSLCIHAQRDLPFDDVQEGQKVIVIAGPTACGKSDLALMLAKMAGGEIVSADSMQVYKGMDIGTAKPSLAQRNTTPHHLIDIRDIAQPFNAVDFYYESCNACNSILARNRVPIVAGGSGFYIHCFLYGPPSGPASLPEVRSHLEKESELLGSQALYERLETLDPDYAKTISPNDKQKIVRALEIMALTRRKVSDLSWRLRHHPINYNFRCWFVHRPREILHERIHQRCDRMIKEGLLEETAALEKMGIKENPTASLSIGYRQALEYLASPQTAEDYEHFIHSFKKATRHYVKRQFTWFRKEPLFRWLDIELHDPEVAVDMILSDYAQQ